MMKTPLDRFRFVALMEGLSFIVLLFIAMPLKYLAGMPMAVRFAGMAHGLLFVLYVFTLLDVALALRWSFSRVAVAFGASLVPFGNFMLDARLRREAQEAPVQPAP